MQRPMRPRSMARSATLVPRFFLYGEPPQDVDDHFLHLETIEARSRPNNWDIRSHAHSDLHHIFFLNDGGGEMHAESSRMRFAAPCLLLVPARVIHAFHFAKDTTGGVLTVSDTYLNELFQREAAFRMLFAESGVYPVSADSPERDSLTAVFRQLSRELAWSAPAKGAAIDANLVSLLVMVLRLGQLNRERSAPVHGHGAQLLAKFRASIEEHFKSNLDIATYARHLRVTEVRLRTVCRTLASRSPTRLIQDRCLLEAKRLLLYSNMSIAEAGFYLGFDDPAYFTRFLTRRLGQSPRAFRQRHAR